MAMRLIAWRYEKLGLPVPPEPELLRLAETVVEDSHRIARERGRNVLGIIREMVEGLKNRDR